MKKINLSIFVTMFGIVFLSTLAHSAVINYTDIGGYTTFQDTNTDRVWLDSDNFFDDAATVGTTGYDMINMATTAGFTFATKSDVEELLGTLFLNNGEWSSYSAVMGYGVPRELIWGMYDDSNGSPFGWAYAFSNNTSWGYSDNSTDANLIQNDGSAGGVDMGIWAYRETGQSNAVPEPGTILLFGTGLLGLVGYKRKRLNKK